MHDDQWALGAHLARQACLEAQDEGKTSTGAPASAKTSG